MANLQDLTNRSEVGAIKPWGKATAPAGYVLCNGAAISRTTYADLFAVIASTYGAGNGSTTFNVPDLQGKMPQGYDGSTYNLAGTGGANTVTVDVTNGLSATSTDTLAVSVTGSISTTSLSTAQIASHTHSYSYLPFHTTSGGHGGWGASDNSTTGTSGGAGSAAAIIVTGVSSAIVGSSAGAAAARITAGNKGSNLR